MATAVPRSVQIATWIDGLTTMMTSAPLVGEVFTREVAGAEERDPQGGGEGGVAGALGAGNPGTALKLQIPWRRRRPGCFL